MKKAILFDLDGTLTDSGEGIINCAQYAFQQMGYPVPPREEMGVFVGPPLWDTFEKFGIPKERTDEAVQIFRSRYVPIGKFENTPYPGIRELLEALGAEGNLLYVATSKPETTAVEVLATKQESMGQSLERLNEKMDSLERRPGQRWESLADKVLLVLAGAFVSFLLAGGAA